MVVKMMKWPPWPPLSSKKYEVIIVVGRIQGLDSERFEGYQKRVVVEVKWKGLKGMALGSLRRSVKRNFTRESNLSDDGVVEWDEEFRNVCNFSGHKEGLFYPWEIAFTVFNGVNCGLKKSSSIIGTALLNVAEYVNKTEKNDLGFTIPLIVPGFNSESRPSLNLSLSVLELRTSSALSDTVHESAPVSMCPSSSEAPSTDKDDFGAIKAGLRKVKTFKDYVSVGKVKKVQCEGESSDGRTSDRSEDGTCPFDSDSLDDDAHGELEGNEDSGLKHSVSYETLALANCAQKLFYSDININDDADCWIYYSNRKSDVVCSSVDDSGATCSGQSLQQSSKFRILSWRKRKLSFRSPKAKGEPLLKKHYADEGGDDIDFDRRQLSSSDESSYGWHKSEGCSTNRSSVSEFGDDSFAVGSWESKEVTSRDGLMKLETQVFFASIDQRSELAAGESACTALVAVIADWLQSNRDEMPIKSEFNSLIRNGSSEWRNLCENETYIQQFPDKHFDLETVLQAKIRPLAEVPEKSFIGFFHPEELEEGKLDFLHGAMSFDNIWDEISGSASELPCNGEPCLVYIVSWNDHFFVLKVERDAYFIIDTLGERLYEGCNQAYVLKFDKDTVIKRLPNESETSDEKPTTEKGQESSNSKECKAEGSLVVSTSKSSNIEKEEVVCRGKESCKEYIKSFLAAIPLRQVQVDLKKGLIASTPLHHRLQIEFHYTVPLLLLRTLENPIKETVAEAPSMGMELSQLSLVVA